MTKDPVLDSMARELRRELVRRGLDPATPPPNRAPSATAWSEYQRLGGKLYANPIELSEALTRRVAEVE